MSEQSLDVWARDTARVEWGSALAGMPAPGNEAVDEALTPKLCPIGRVLYGPNHPGRTWQLISGFVRIDRQGPDGEYHFSRLAMPGDWLGMEHLFGRSMGTQATTITEAILAQVPTPRTQQPTRELLDHLALVEYRGAQALSLRAGDAMERLLKLLKLLAGPQASGSVVISMPTLQNMADILDIRPESVSRLLRSLKSKDILQRITRHRAVLKLDPVEFSTASLGLLAA